jgi:hypothetical protein
MASISSVSLNDTYRLVQLARETALVQGRTEQAKRLTPVVEEMRELVKTKPQVATVAVGGMMQQSGFQKLLEVSQASKPASNEMSVQTSVNTIMERNRMVMAMSSADMNDVDIARQMGMTRDEVRMIVSVNRFAYSNYARGAGI